MTTLTRGKNKFWGAREVYLCEFEKSTRAREIYSSVDRTKKVKTKKKKRSSSQKFYEIRCESTKITKIWAANTNLGVLVAPSLLIFSGHSPRLGGTIFVWGAQVVIWGGTVPECPLPRGARPETFKPKITSNILFYVLTLLRA